MLSEHDKELLTAFVDGEMTARQRKATLHLLHQSSEARAFLRDLQENAHLFKLLPHHSLEFSFATHVLSEIAARGLRPIAPKPQRAHRRWPVWAGAAAAAVLVAVGLWYGATRPNIADPDDGVAKLILPEPPPRKIEMAFKDLVRPEKIETLRMELKREAPVQLDLGVRHGTRAIERFVQVLKENKFDLVMSPVAVASIKKNQPKTQYVVYAEGIKAEEVLSMLQQLGNEARGKGQAGFESLVVTSLDSQNRQKLSDQGVNLQQRNASEKTSPAKTKAPALPSPERFAVVLTNATDGRPGFAPEVQAFLDSRRELNPGGMQLLVVLTPAVA